MKIAIFYFSGTGNTMWVTEQVQAFFIENNVECEIYSIEQVNQSETALICEEADRVGFAYPIYGSDLPEPMKFFLDELPSISKKVFVYCTQLAFSGDGAWVYKNELIDKGYEIAHSAHFIMPHNITLTPVLFPITGKRLHGLILKFSKWRAKRFVDAILRNKRFHNGKHGYLLGMIQRGPYRKYLPVLQTLVGVDESICISCGICARICPMDNIVMEDFPEFRGQCTECMRCYNFCPVSAITYWKIHPKPGQKKYIGPVPSYRPEKIIRKQ